MNLKNGDDSHLKNMAREYALAVRNEKSNTRSRIRSKLISIVNKYPKATQSSIGTYFTRLVHGELRRLS